MDTSYRRVFGGYPTAQKTKLGWISNGPITNRKASLRKFWEQEKAEWKSFPTEEEQKMEDHYRRTTKHLRMEGISLSYHLKQTRVHMRAMEKRLIADPKLTDGYNKCLQDYLDLNYIEKVPRTEINNLSYYLPQLSSKQVLLQKYVVFNASAKTSGNYSTIYS